MGYRIAIVDDDHSVRRALGRLLRVEGYEVETFGSAQEVLDSEHRAVFACLVVDVHLGGMSGLELMGALADAGCKVPAVVITAHDDEATRERARGLRASAYLRKPLDAPVLLDAVRNAISGFSSGS